MSNKKYKQMNQFPVYEFRPDMFSGYSGELLRWNDGNPIVDGLGFFKKRLRKW